MSTLLKILFWLSLTIIIGITVFLIIILGLPLEFKDRVTETSFYNFTFLGAPIAILFTLTGTLRKQQSTRSRLRKIIYTFIAAMCGVFIMIMIAFDGQCKWIIEKTLYTYRTNSAKKIVVRFRSCGLLNQQQSREVHELTPVLNFLLKSKLTDTTSLDPAKWTKISSP